MLHSDYNLFVVNNAVYRLYEAGVKKDAFTDVGSVDCENTVDTYIDNRQQKPDGRCSRSALKYVDCVVLKAMYQNLI